MCIGLTIMIVPPTAVLGGYGCWYAGERFVLQRFLESARRRGGNEEPRKPESRSARTVLLDGDTPRPRQGVMSFAAGAATVYGVYRAQFPLVQKWEQSSPNYVQNNLHISQESSKFVPPHKSQAPFQPPRTLSELGERMGRPLIGRFGAGAVAFFCAGCIQAYVAALLDSDFS